MVVSIEGSYADKDSSSLQSPPINQTEGNTKILHKKLQ